MDVILDATMDVTDHVIQVVEKVVKVTAMDVLAIVLEIAIQTV